MATVYGNKLTHSSYKFNFFSYLTYTTSANNDTTYALKLTGGLADNASGDVGWYFDTVQLVGTNQTTKTSSSFHYKDSGGNSNSSPGCCPAWSNVSWSWPKTHATQTVTVKVQSRDSSWSSNTWSTASYTATIPAKTSYPVTYNANGGSGAPAAQTKWYGEVLTLSSTKPTRTGYTFLGWSTSSTATSATYCTGTNNTTNNSYAGNAKLTLYAVWQENVYSITYNVNGGSGSNTQITNIKYTQSITIGKNGSTHIIPTRDYYNFKGWSTSANGSLVYSQSTSTTTNKLSSTNNGTVTLYAVWETQFTPPKVTNLEAKRSKDWDHATEEADDGTAAMAKYTVTRAKRTIITWTGNTESSSTSYLKTSSSIRIYEKGTSTNYRYYSYTDSGSTSSYSTGWVGVTGGTSLTLIDTGKSYDVYAYLSYHKDDGTSSSTLVELSQIESTYISQAYYIIDINATGRGIGFGRAVSDSSTGMWISLPSPQLRINNITTGGIAVARFTVNTDSNDYILDVGVAANGHMGIYYGAIGSGRWIAGYYPEDSTLHIPNAVSVSSLTSSGDISSSNGYLKSTKNSNTITIGSQHASFCHIYNSASIPFIFNNSVLSLNHNNLGSTTYYWANLYLSGKIYDSSGRKLLKVVEKSTSLTAMAASTSVDSNFSVAETGYTPIGVVGYDLDGSGCGYIHVLAIEISGSNCHYQLSTHASAHAASGDPSALKLYVNVLYIATSMA